MTAETDGLPLRRNDPELVGAFTPVPREIAMARITFIAGACLLALAACSKTDQETSPKTPAPKP